MQWAGFLIAAFAIYGRATAMLANNRCTIAEARKRLDEIEANP